MINDVVDIARIETGQLDLDITDFDLRRMIEQACTSALQDAHTKGLTFDLRIDPLRGTGRA